MAQVPLITVFLVATWAEGVVYGFFFAIFFATMYVNFGVKTGSHDGSHNHVMVGVSLVMFFIATFHLTMNIFRLVRGYVDYANTPGGPVGYIGDLPLWDHILKDTLYATQEILGNAAAIYRCWVLWNRNWFVIILPSMLFIVSVVSGYTVCGLYPSTSAGSTVFISRLQNWILTFYSVAVVQNIMTTGLMSYRIWLSHRSSAAYVTGKGLLPVARILIESAALQLIAEIILLALYSRDINAQYILLECVTPIVGITFNVITMRIRLHTLEKHSMTSSDRVRTIGSMASRRIQVDITQDIELQVDGKPTFQNP